MIQLQSRTKSGFFYAITRAARKNERKNEIDIQSNEQNHITAYYVVFLMSYKPMLLLKNE